MEICSAKTLMICKQIMRAFSSSAKVLTPPESVYFSEERLVFQEETLQVREWYRRFDLQSVKLHEPDDHVGLELTFWLILPNVAWQHLNKMILLSADTAGGSMGVSGFTPGEMGSNVVSKWRKKTTDFYRGSLI